MFEDVEVKIKKNNKILFSRESECLQELIQLVCKQNHRTLILWAFECVQKPLEVFENTYPNEIRPRKAFELCQQWSQGIMKMPIAKRAILDCHQVCKEIDDPYMIALCHAIGQGLSTVHVESHAIGLVTYELTGLVLSNRDNYQTIINDKINYYVERLTHYQNNVDLNQYQWADFLLKEKPNKETELWKKRKGT